MSEQGAPGAHTGIGEWVGRALLLAALALGVVALVLQGVDEAERAKPVSAGTMAPDLPLVRHGGGQLKLTDFKGKVVMLDFWATWCPPCRQEMPDLVKVAQEYESKGLVFVAASSDDGPDAAGDIERFAQGLPGLREHVVMTNAELTDSFRVEVLPTLYLIDREGRILGGHAGAMDESDIRRRVEEALGH